MIWPSQFPSVNGNSEWPRLDLDTGHVRSTIHLLPVWCDSMWYSDRSRICHNLFSAPPNFTWLFSDQFYWIFNAREGLFCLTSVVIKRIIFVWTRMQFWMKIVVAVKISRILPSIKTTRAPQRWRSLAHGKRSSRYLGVRVNGIGLIRMKMSGVRALRIFSSIWCLSHTAMINGLCKACMMSLFFNLRNTAADITRDADNLSLSRLIICPLSFFLPNPVHRVLWTTKSNVLPATHNCNHKTSPTMIDSKFYLGSNLLGDSPSTILLDWNGFG